MYIKRSLEDKIKERIFKGQVIILYGPRQAGKTTLLKHIIEPFKDSVRYVDCELLSNRSLLERRDDKEIFSFVQNFKIVVFDEAQSIRGIGSLLKTLFDHHPEVQYIASGSSSFDLANEISEPLTGRSVEFTLYPFGLTEIVKNSFDAELELKNLMRYGGYPGLLGENEEEKERKLNTLVNQYLYKNVLSIEGLKKPEFIVSLLKLLAFQIGNEVSFREISNTLSVSIQTVQKYISLLEQNYIIFRVGAYSTNQRKEVVKTKKIYFIDLGIRNVLVGNFKPINTEDRNDVGLLFENCMFVERLKYLTELGNVGFEQFFWRTTNQQEIDYIETSKDKIGAFEFKLDKNKKINKTTFNKFYKNIKVKIVSPKEAFDFTKGTNFT